MGDERRGLVKDNLPNKFLKNIAPIYLYKSLFFKFYNKIIKQVSVWYTKYIKQDNWVKTDLFLVDVLKNVFLIFVLYL